MVERTVIGALVAEARLFTGLEAQVQAAIASEMRPVSFTAGQVLFSRGDEGRELYLVVNGRVRLSVLTQEGRELSFTHATAGDIFGEIAMLDGGVRTADATAVGAVEAVVLGRPALNRLLAEHPSLALATIRLLCGRLRDADMQLEGVALHRIEVRLARYLLSLAAQVPAAQGRGEVGIDLGMSQGELALLLGASRPKVNAALVMLED